MKDDQSFPGKKWLFVVLLATMMAPTQLSLVPSFVIMAKFGWVGSLKALIIPGMVNAFGIFWIKQYAEESIPSELLDAERIDGCGFFRIYWSIALPILRPALSFLGAFTFIGVWNDYLWPLMSHFAQKAKWRLLCLTGNYAKFISALPDFVGKVSLP